MVDDHWFDTLNKMLTHGAARRGILSAAGAIVAGRMLGPTRGAEAKNRKKRRKGKKKGKPKPKPRSCSAGACARIFTTPAARARCERTCSQCIGDDPRRFCFAAGAPFCCGEGAKCCDGFCCDEDSECCGELCCGGPEIPEQQCCLGLCVNTNTDIDHCGRCNNPCPPGDICRDGVCDCEPGTTLCGGICIDTNEDPNNCGGCNQRCSNPNRPDCCDGACVNTESFPFHCGGCGNRCEINETCHPGVCRCIHECCNTNTSGVCVTPRTCCPEPCSRCTIGECLRWRDGIEGGFCEEFDNFCDVVTEYCPLFFNGVHEGFFDCCGPGETCTDAGCTSAP